MSSSPSKMSVSCKEQQGRRMRLDFGKIKHIGRHHELQQMTEAFERSLQGRSTTVIIEAESGMGKSSLIEAFLQDVFVRRQGDATGVPLLGRGKFEERNAASQPFAAIVELVEDVVHDILQRNQSEIWLKRIAQAVRMEYFILLEIIPSVACLGDAIRELQIVNSKEDILDDHLQVSSASSSSISLNFEAFGDMAKQEWRFEQFRIAFRELIACIAKHHSLILVLDDVQFAEQDSLALIQVVMENPIPDLKLLIVCATRPNNELKVSLGSFHDRKTTRGPQGLFIKLWGLSEEEMCLLLQILLDEQPSPTIGKLALAIIDKTVGNAFVVNHFLRQMELDGLFVFDTESGRWSWDINQIKEYMEGSFECVEQVIVKNLQALDEYQRSLLITAASFGASHFELSVMVQAMDALHIVDQDETKEEHAHETHVRLIMSKVQEGLDSSMENGILEHIAPGAFKFCHDRIREAAYSLLPTGYARGVLHLKIGRQLRRWMHTLGESGTGLCIDSVTMHAAKHSSLGADLVKDVSEVREIAELNYTAAELSAKKAAFFPAMEYLLDAIHVLGPNAWKDHFALCMKLHIALTRIQFNCGKLEECNNTADLVANHAKDFGQKKDAYHQKLLCLLSQERALEAVDLCLMILKGLGYKLPKRFLSFYVIRRYYEVERYLSRVSDDDIRKLPEFSDPIVDDQIHALYRLGELTYFGAPSIYLNLLSVDVLYMMKAKGNHPLVTPMGLMVWSLLLIVHGNFKESRRFASLAVEMAQRLCTKQPAVEARTKHITTFFTKAWYEPLQELVEPLLANFRTQLEFGGMEDYHIEGVNAPRFLFFCGRPLPIVQVECSCYMGVLRDYKREFLWGICAPLAQAIANFMGEADEPSVLFGEWLDTATLTKIEQSKVETGRFQYQLYSMIVAYHFGDLEEAASSEQEMRTNLYDEGSEPPGLSTRIFYTVLIHFALFRQTKLRKYKNKALSSFKVMAKWVSKGATNCEYMKLILDAEWWSIQPKKTVDTVVEQYDKAIERTNNMGVLHHEALVYELTVNYLAQFHFISAQKMLSYLNRSIACYEKWGGHAKVKDLRIRYKRLIGNPIDSTTGT